jgi:hypothetical protein
MPSNDVEKQKNVYQWSFGAHFLLQKFLLGRPEHQSNKSILEYSMKCLDDPSDEIVRGIEYGRWAMGTKGLDGIVNDCDSSGDIDLFCGGLLDGISTEYHDMFKVIPGEEATMLRVDEGVLRGVTTIDQNVSSCSDCKYRAWRSFDKKYSFIIIFYVHWNPCTNRRRAKEERERRIR